MRWLLIPGAVALILGLSRGIRSHHRSGLGDTQISFEEPSGAAPGPMTVYLHRPTTWRAQDGPILVVLHGDDRDAQSVRDAWRSVAEQYGILLVTPEFSKTKFPGTRWYDLGNGTDEERRPQPPGEWTFYALDRAVDAARRATGAASERFTLYGFSSGGQFAHRYLLLTGAPRADLVVAASPGWYTLPVADRAFPVGLGREPVSETARRAVLGHPFVIHLGEEDTNPRDDFGIPPGEQGEIAQQGTHRFARGWYFYEASRKEAERLGVPFAWKIVTAPGIGHSVGGLAQHAARAGFVP
jgi:poly(3-hydroxybutyrate) depolymerase